MAPILAAEIGIPHQIIDDTRLVELRSALASIEDRVKPGKKYASPEEVELPLDISHLLSVIEPWQTWTFEEQVSTCCGCVHQMINGYLAGISCFHCKHVG